MEAVTHTMLGPLMQKSCVGAFKTLDAFDFSIEHLSLYERRLGLMNMEVHQEDLRVYDKTAAGNPLLVFGLRAPWLCNAT